MDPPGQWQCLNIATGPTKSILITDNMFVYIVGWTISDAGEEEAAGTRGAKAGSMAASCSISSPDISRSQP